METGKTWSVSVPITHASDGKTYGKIIAYFQEEYDVIGNYSTIKVTKMTGTNTLRSGSFKTAGSISVDGTAWYSWASGDWLFGLNSVSETSDFVSYNGSTFPSGLRIDHNSDGEKTIDVAVTISSYRGSDPEWVGVGGTVTESVALTKTHSHSYEAVVTEPTCTEQGYTTHTCDCGDSYVDGYVDALGHDYDDGVVTVKPTYKTKGEQTYTCRRCGVTYAEVIPMLPSGAIIRDSKGFSTYHAHIHNGTKWQRYAPFMFSKGAWKRCAFGIEPVTKARRY